MPRFLLFDGELTYLTLAYRHRRLRLTSIFWARPRFFRMGRFLIFILRGYNVTTPQGARLTSRLEKLQQAVPAILAETSRAASLTSWLA